jgi:hypothetical protein
MGVPVNCALNSEPIALPSPGATWTLQATSRPDARLNPLVLQRVHDRQFGRAGIAEKVRDAFVLQQGQESRPSGDARHPMSSLF